ncbi:hypothetical protein H4R34_000445 [Dimargaris verticillata]|uniref:Uncharacterized protein n=1 Tax=Dimargaris verticillata TaxID=2761393 RepID=A0A9W8B735_9FUNG|nr:hypothetical protein H4R34_000445 [Dimargaris verticillata]
MAMNRFQRAWTVLITGLVFALSLLLFQDIPPPSTPRLAHLAPLGDAIALPKGLDRDVTTQVNHFLASSPDHSQLHYILVHRAYPNHDDTHPQVGLIHFYQRHLPSLYQATTPTDRWATHFTDKLMGPIAHAVLDQTYPGHTQLAILYYQMIDETLHYYLRVYYLSAPLERHPLSPELPSCPTTPETSSASGHDYTSPFFTRCANAQVFQSVDYRFPGSTWVTHFTLRNQTITYARFSDVHDFRVMQLPDLDLIQHANSAGSTNRASHALASSTLHSQPGSLLRKFRAPKISQSTIAILPTTRPDSFSLLAAKARQEPDRYRFFLTKLENATNDDDQGQQYLSKDGATTSVNTKSPPAAGQSLWVTSRLLQPSLFTSSDFRALSNQEEYLLQKNPFIATAPMTTLVYFPLMDMVVTLDQVLEQEPVSKIASQDKQHTSVSSSLVESLVLRIYNLQLIDMGEETNVYTMTVNQYGTALVLTTLDHGVMVYQRNSTAISASGVVQRNHVTYDYRTWIPSTPSSWSASVPAFLADSFVAPLLTRFRQVPESRTDPLNWRLTHDWNLRDDIPLESTSMYSTKEEFRCLLLLSTFEDRTELPPNTMQNILLGMLSDGTLAVWDLSVHGQPSILNRLLSRQWPIFLAGNFSRFQ